MTTQKSIFDFIITLNPETEFPWEYADLIKYLSHLDAAQLDNFFNSQIQGKHELLLENKKTTDALAALAKFFDLFKSKAESAKQDIVIEQTQAAFKSNHVAMLFSAAANGLIIPGTMLTYTFWSSIVPYLATVIPVLLHAVAPLLFSVILASLGGTAIILGNYVLMKKMRADRKDDIYLNKLKLAVNGYIGAEIKKKIALAEAEITDLQQTSALSNSSKDKLTSIQRKIAELQETLDSLGKRGAAKTKATLTFKNWLLENKRKVLTNLAPSVLASISFNALAPLSMLALTAGKALVLSMIGAGLLPAAAALATPLGIGIVIAAIAVLGIIAASVSIYQQYQIAKQDSILQEQSQQLQSAQLLSTCISKMHRQAEAIQALTDELQESAQASSEPVLPIYNSLYQMPDTTLSKNSKPSLLDELEQESKDLSALRRNSM